MKRRNLENNNLSNIKGKFKNFIKAIKNVIFKNRNKDICKYNEFETLYLKDNEKYKIQLAMQMLRCKLY